MAESSYPDELATWIEKRAAKKRRQDAATVAFLAVRDDVKSAIESGYAVTTIYEHMKETARVKCSYETFRKHVQRFIKAKPEAPTPKPNSVTNQKMQEEGTNANPTKASKPTGITGFNFNPKPNVEDLL